MRWSWPAKRATATPPSRIWRRAWRWSNGGSRSTPRRARAGRSPRAADSSAGPFFSGVASGLGGGELFVDDPLDRGGIELSLIRLHDLADDAAGRLRIRDAEPHDRLPDDRARLVVGGGLGEELRAEPDLEVDLGDRVGPARADRGVLLARFPQLLLIGRDHVQPQGVVERPLEPGRGAAFHVLRLDHPDAVGGAAILGAHRLLEEVIELDVDRHDAAT